jgi:hypothetical protein
VCVCACARARLCEVGGVSTVTDILQPQRPLNCLYVFQRTTSVPVLCLIEVTVGVNSHIISHVMSLIGS